MFKNIFCAMCNPPEYKEEFLINECDNSTSIYFEACHDLPFNEASFPYKNYFCFMCNHGDNNTIYYTDANMDEVPSEAYIQGEDFPYQFDFKISYNVDNINMYMERFLKTSNIIEIVSTSSTENIYLKGDQSQCLEGLGSSGSEHPGMLGFPPQILPLPPVGIQTFDPNTLPSLNITNLIRTSFAFSRNGACTPGLLPDYTLPLQKPCSCTIGCGSDCCDDFAFKVPWTCIDGRYPRDENGKEFLAIGGCIENPSMERLCSGRNSREFYHAFPVTAETEVRESYVNVFCFLCNRKTNDKNNVNVTETVTEEMEIWPLVVNCSEYVNHRHFHEFQSLIEYLNQSSCVMKFSPSSNSSRCNENCDKLTAVVDKCNISKAWSTFNEDIQIACENSDSFRFPRIKVDSNIYKNKFCAICNPFKGNTAENYCSNFQGHTNVNQACEEFPRINVCRPYKNVFCEMCQNDGEELHCYEELPPKKDASKESLGPSIHPNRKEDIGNFRSTFTLVAYDTSGAVTDAPNVKCLQHQIYDSYQVGICYT
jgi:hypothetical protein